jgi:nitrate reductase gamma subunit
MKDPKTGRIVLKMVKEGLPLKMTSHRFANFKDKKACEKCHFVENRLGAPIRVLPAKSLICIACHSATISAKDPVSIIALLLFLLGIVLTVSFWFQGTVGDPSFSTGEKISYVSEKMWQIIFSRKILTLLKVFVVDILFLRRILKESLSRWTIHSLIYLPFFLRFFIGLILLILSKVFPMSPAVALLLDKNYSFLAFTFDFLGLCIIIGIVGATMRRFQSRSQKALATGQDFLVLGLIGGILLTGFVVEGMRILLTAIPLPVTLPSFLGYPISLFLGLFPIRWEVVYPYGWYIHAILTGALIAYLPFSKMFHILVSPLVFMIKALMREK